MRTRDARILVWGMGLSSAVLILAACLGPKPPATTYTPPSAVVAGDPWPAARKLAATVPNSILTVGHGDNMLPFYPEGTVLVLQTLQWEHLREGMTVIYMREAGNHDSLAGNILTENHGGYWEAVGAQGGFPDPVNVTPANYIGTIVAAFRTPNPSDPTAMLRAVPPDQAATCMMRCHIH